VSIIGYLCTKIVPVTSKEMARTLDKFGMIKADVNWVNITLKLTEDKIKYITRILRG
jgi:hypothetical protein